MYVTTKLKMDLSKPDFGLSIDAVQGDAYSRNVSISLYNGLLPWKIPEDVKAAIRYAKPDYTKGYYDTLPNGESAWSCQENVITLYLAPQMLTVPGDVKAQIELIQDTHILSTFCLTVRVEPNPAAGVMQSEDYINWLKWIQEQSDKHAQQVQLSAHTASQASEIASLAAENAADSANFANTAAQDALEAAVSANMSQIEASSIAENVSAIVAGNEAYTKQESDALYSSRIIQNKNAHTIFLSDSAVVPLQNLRIMGKTMQNDTPSPYAPVPLESVGESVTVTVCGKNLFPFPYSNSTVTTGGIAFTVNADGSVTANGKSNAAATFAIVSSSKTTVILPKGEYFLSGCPSGGSSATYSIVLRNMDRTIQAIDTGRGARFVLPEAMQIHCTIYFAKSDIAAENLVFKPILNVGSSAMPFEQKPLQHLTVSTPNSLPGIPVTSGGNYTDENGQQWICDEVDFEKGVYVQRVKKSVYGGNDMIYGESSSSTGAYQFYIKLSDSYAKAPVLCNYLPNIYGQTYGACWIGSDRYFLMRFPEESQSTTMEQFASMRADTPLEFIYALATPIETTLSVEELTVYAALHTNYPNTTVINDGGADMEVKYVADTKLYIDGKFNKLAAALVNNA